MRGRPKNAMPTVEWRSYVRADLAAKVELLLKDPLRDRVKYGERGKLIESLLERWVQETMERAKAGMLCQDEGCPHFGTPHGHGEGYEAARIV